MRHNPKLIRVTDSAALIRVRNDSKYTDQDQVLRINCTGNKWYKPEVEAALQELEDRFGDLNDVVYIECEAYERVWMLAKGSDMGWMP